MPLDPSIFMQYAQLQGRNNENLANTIGNVAQNYTAYKNKKTEGLDLEKLAQGFAVKTEMGAPTSPEEQAAFNVYQKFEAAKQGMDPYTGQTYSKFKPFGIDGTIPEAGAMGGGFDLGNVAQAMPASFAGGTNKIPGKPEDLANMDMIPKLDVSMLQETGDPAMDTYRQGMAAQNAAMANNAAPSGFDTGLVAPVQPVTPNNNLRLTPDQKSQLGRKGTEMEATADMAIRTEKAKSDIAIDQAGAVETAKKKAENAVNTEQQISSVDSALSALDNMANDLKDAPNGYAEGFAAKVADGAGYPTAASKSQARYEGRIPLLSAKLKKFIRDPGEGNFSDADQKNLLMMMPSENDSVESKKEKLMAVREELKRLKKEKSGTAPGYKGFKYLGTE